MLFTCLLISSAVLSSLWSLSGAVSWEGLVSFLTLHAPERVTWSCTPLKIKFHWEKPVPLPIGGADPHGVSIVMTKSLSCWWPDGGSSVVMTTSCMGHTQAETINRPVFTENRASTSCFSPHLWHEVQAWFLTSRILQYYWRMKSVQGYILLWNGCFGYNHTGYCNPRP